MNRHQARYLVRVPVLWCQLVRLNWRTYGPLTSIELAGLWVLRGWYERGDS